MKLKLSHAAVSPNVWKNYIQFIISFAMHFTNTGAL